MSNYSLSTMIDDFLVSRSVGQKRSPRTIQTYKGHLDAFIAGIGDIAIDAVRPAIIRRYIDELQNADTHYRGIDGAPGPLSQETIKGRLRTIRALFNWLEREGILTHEQNPMRNIPIAQAEVLEFKAATKEDWLKLIEVCDDSPLGLRNRALLAFTFDSGCRAAGVVGLTPNNLFINERYALVTEKGNKRRAVGFTAPTAEILWAWMKVRPEQATTVFCNLRNDRNRAHPLTVSGLNHIFLALKKAAGAEGYCNPHAWRKACGIEVTKASGNIALTSKILGHASISITAKHYAVYAFKDVSEQYPDVGPLRNYNERKGTIE